MSHYDLFNGDADGIFALIQLRKAQPRKSILVSGVKRDIELLAKVDANNRDSLTVLDISLDSNRSALQQALLNGASVDYVDHHFAGEIPSHPKLATVIETGPAWCTSLLVDRLLHHRYPDWAIAGAFGDNLDTVASHYGQRLAMSEPQLRQLQTLGRLVNYNGYGLTLDDLQFTPVELYQRLLAYDDAIAAAHGQEVLALQQQHDSDMSQTQALEPLQTSTDSQVYLLPNQAWARRVSGTLANQLQLRHPRHAIAMLLPIDGGYQVSVRVPTGFALTADKFCRQFPTGGGRKLAAGINLLESSQYELLLQMFNQQLLPVS
ncbi:DHH family phosphoesterase [Ferrimonas lipolytica]|uniref:DHH family phosphoesterase n=1 Tax=Ferrimonas lipolytica TaxID=2724191 RepID=A0A6H1U9M6_9GAMM|nr:DHH family phosphoesterase [Ferrimonas lipolytica]QIZ75741.1 DHH family phosphoesterase [Ferrimonas lipolytica]